MKKNNKDIGLPEKLTFGFLAFMLASFLAFYFGINIYGLGKMIFLFLVFLIPAILVSSFTTSLIYRIMVKIWK